MSSRRSQAKDSAANYNHQNNNSARYGQKDNTTNHVPHAGNGFVTDTADDSINDATGINTSVSHYNDLFQTSAVFESLGMHHVLTLAYLLSRGARHNHVEITTTMLGHDIKKSQQSASRHLADLEQDGFIERGPAATGKGMSVKVTKAGFKAVEQISSVLYGSLKLADASFEKKMLQGVLVSGMGEGAYYMALDGYTRQFSSMVGYVPFPGTLNIRLQRSRDKELIRHLVSAHTKKTLTSFSDGVRTYGWVKCFSAVLHACDDPSRSHADKNSRHRRSADKDGSPHGTGGASLNAGSGNRDDAACGGLPCELIILERTHHDDSIIELISPVCLRDAASISDGSQITVELLPDDA